MRYVYDDGGRGAAGFKGQTNDCVVRAIAIATARDYREVYKGLNGMAQHERPRSGKTRSSPRTGVYKQTIRRYMQAIGWVWTPTMHIGSGTTVHLKADELPAGRLVVNLSRHLSAVIDGVIHDTADPSRNETRAVYGYWMAPHRVTSIPVARPNNLTGVSL
jgi:hypothetical protein